MPDNTMMEARQPKLFQCNYSYAPPLQMLDIAAAAISQIMNKFTGQPIWRINARRQRIPNEVDGFNLLAGSSYTVGNMSAAVNMGLNAIGQGAAGTRFVVALQDSMGWDVPTAENDADAAMLAIATYLGRSFTALGPWMMLQGRWRHAHKFDTPHLTDQPRALAPTQDASADMDIPEGLFNQPGDQTFRNMLPGVDPQAAIMIVGRALHQKWKLERGTLESELTLLAVNTLLSNSLGIAISCSPVQGGSALTMRFSDLGNWASPEARTALQESKSAVVTGLRARIPGIELQPLS